jgi:hypothetical protein
MSFRANVVADALGAVANAKTAITGTTKNSFLITGKTSSKLTHPRWPCRLIETAPQIERC